MPLDNQPGMILGYRKNGLPIYVIAGASEGAPEGGDAGGDSDQGGDQQDGQEGAQQAPPAPTAEDIIRLQRALDKERATSRANTAAARELAALKASQQSDTEKAIAAARDEASKEVAAKYTRRLAGLSIKAAAGGKFQNPADAYALLSDRLDEFVNDDGDVDERGIAAAVDGLLKDRPYLGAVKKAPDFDGGQRNGATGTVDMNRLIRRAAGIQ